MFERFTDRARQTIVRAQEEARALDHQYIGTEHMLMALVHDHRGMGAMVLQAMGASEERVRDRLGHYVERGDPGAAPSGHIPFTPRAKRVLELGLRESLQLGHETIGTEHLLLALIREEDGLAGQAVRDLGIHLNTARLEVLTRHPPQAPRVVAEEPLVPPRGSPLPPLRAEIESLRDEVGRLRDLLRRHGIDPDQDPGAEPAP